MDHLYQAKQLLKWEKKQSKKNPGTPIFINWRGNIYYAVMHEIRSPYGNEIVGLDILSGALIGELEGLVNAISQLDPKRLRLNADHDLDLEGKMHILKRVESSLTKLEYGQLEYLHRINFTVTDISTSTVHKLGYDHLYKDPEEIDPHAN